MKQHITLDQIKELNSKGFKKYSQLQKEFEWFDSEMIWLNDNVFFLTIGQMIEYLAYKGELPTFSFNGGNAMEFEGKFENAALLCNRLWEVVKKELER